MEDRFVTDEIGIFLNRAIKIAIAEGSVGKVADFAAHTGLTDNVIVNITNTRKVPTYAEWLKIVFALKTISPRAYDYLKTQLFQEVA
jgi:hypothetical protein